LWKQPECWVSLAWPLLIHLLTIFTPTRIGLLQVRFMRELGYEPSALNPLSSSTTGQSQP
jgi:hypothetical protein